MKTKQYTIRNIPEPVDRYLRKRAKLSGKSLNQVIIDELSERASMSDSGTSLSDSLNWFIGGQGMDEATLKALEYEDRLQKEILKNQFENDY